MSEGMCCACEHPITAARAGSECLRAAGGGLLSRARVRRVHARVARRPLAATGAPVDCLNGGVAASHAVGFPARAGRTAGAQMSRIALVCRTINNRYTYILIYIYFDLTFSSVTHQKCHSKPQGPNKLWRDHRIIIMSAADASAGAPPPRAGVTGASLVAAAAAYMLVGQSAAAYADCLRALAIRGAAGDATRVAASLAAARAATEMNMHDQARGVCA